jgi:hypothetical protein
VGQLRTAGGFVLLSGRDAEASDVPPLVLLLASINPIPSVARQIESQSRLTFARGSSADRSNRAWDRTPFGAGCLPPIEHPPSVSNVVWRWFDGATKRRDDESFGFAVGSRQGYRRRQHSSRAKGAFGEHRVGNVGIMLDRCIVRGSTELHCPQETPAASLRWQRRVKTSAWARSAAARAAARLHSSARRFGLATGGYRTMHR